MIAVVALPRELVDLKGGSFKNPEGELLKDQDLEEELLGDPEGDFLLGLIRSEIWSLPQKGWKANTRFSQNSSWRFSNTNQACNPP